MLHAFWALSHQDIILGVTARRQGEKGPVFSLLASGFVSWDSLVDPALVGFAAPYRPRL